ncbi:unnamed protein product [Angiostrongylus costaricensis]|uniref:Transposase n=1 Tax=Angiostrongylus costaricensis TaxID=334426 RepID=A0A158PEV8_ANGCS|nr:unnamed protein product [Angiostrongylus costaricensis]
MRSRRDDARSIPFHTSKGWDPKLRSGQRSKIKDAVPYAKQSKIRWAGQVMRMTTDGLEPLVTGFPEMSNVLQEEHQPDGQFWRLSFDITDSAMKLLREELPVER